MKNLISCAFLLISLGSAATVITVDNKTIVPGSPGQYTTIQAAIDTAQAGDTIYVHGSSTAYDAAGTINITKALTLLGAGFNPQKENSLPSSTGAMNIYVGNVNVIGFNTGYIYLYNSQFESNIYIARNRVGWVSTATSVGWSGVIEQNFFFYNGSSGIPVGSTVFINNNIFANTYIEFYGSSDTHLITNNIFIQVPGCGGYSYAFSQLNNSSVSNNIFYDMTILSGIATNNSFNNNLTFSTSLDSATIANQTLMPPGTGNFGSGNIINEDPKFVDASIVCDALSGALNDFRLQGGSPAKNAGTDNKDIGITGGSNPWYANPGIFGGEPAIPQVKAMNVINGSVPVGGMLNVTAVGKKQN